MIPLFNDGNLLNLALTHYTFDRQHNNKHLETVGDSITRIILSEHFRKKLPDAPYDRINRLVEQALMRKYMAAHATRLGLGDIVMLGDNNDPGLRERPLTLANTLRAVIGAIYQDQGLEVTREFVLQELVQGAARKRGYSKWFPGMIPGFKKA